ncbi:EGF-like domain protein [Cooperia oncophora]
MTANEQLQEQEEVRATMIALSSCSQCDPLGTSSCEKGPHGFICVCKPNWEGSYCRQMPNQCALSHLECGENGNCTSEIDRAFCSCSEKYVGEHCQIAVNNITFESANENSQAFCQSLRSLTVLLAAIVALLFQHPAIFGIAPMQCKTWFYIATICFSIGGYLLFDEQLVLASLLERVPISEDQEDAAETKAKG